MAVAGRCWGLGRGRTPLGVGVGVVLPCRIGSSALSGSSRRGCAVLRASSVLSLLMSRLRANGKDSLNHTIQRWACYLNMMIRIVQYEQRVGSTSTATPT